MLTLLLACGGPSAPPTPTVDPEATQAAVDALCKLAEGAGQACAREADGARVGERRVGVEARLVPDERSLGIVSLRGVVDLRVDDATFTTRFAGFGGNRGEALSRTAHEWAVVSAVAVVDLALDPVGRPALSALEPAPAPLTLAGAPVLRGWALVRPNHAIDHAALLAHVEPALRDRRPTGVLTFQGTRQNGAYTLECWTQGEPDPALCDAARTWTWPEHDHELRLAYLVLPGT